MTYKAGFLGFIGLPNAGKSTLANQIVGEKFSIVCSKAQTTRKRVLGIYSDKKMQAILVDAPGVIKKTQGINQFLQEEYQDVMRKSDSLAACLNLDAPDMEELLAICEMVKESKKPWFIIITKTDTKKVHRLSLLRSEVEKYGVPIISISNLFDKNKNKELFLERAYEVLPESAAPLYSEDYYTLENLKDIASEVVREKCFEYLHQEIPYGLAVKVRSFEEGETLDKIYLDIIVEKKAFKAILIGTKGKHLKRIGTKARLELEERFGKKVYLDLYVKVKEKWTKNPLVLKDLGYVKQEA